MNTPEEETLTDEDMKESILPCNFKGISATTSNYKIKSKRYYQE